MKLVFDFAFQHKHCENDKVCKIVELTMCPGCWEETHPDLCQCSSTYEPECVPAHPTRECCEKNFVDFRYICIYFLEKEVSGSIMKICTGQERLIRSHSSARFCFELSGNSN